MLHLNLATCVLCVLVFTLSCNCVVEDSDLVSLRKVLFQTDSGNQPDLSVPCNDARLQAIKQLGKAGSGEAVHILQEFLTSHRMNLKLKQHALVTLGQIGTELTIDAIRQFERWSKKRLMEPLPSTSAKRTTG
jgi:HEAT repeat protein